MMGGEEEAEDEVAVEDEVEVKGDFTCAAFTTDMWTSAAGDPFMGLTIHFIDKHWRLHR